MSDVEAPETLTVDEVTFAVRRSARRRTIGITIPREGLPIVALPARCSRRRAEEAVVSKLGWVRRKLGERLALAQLPPHRYEPGELFPYLGREYALVLVDDAADGKGPGRTRTVRAAAKRRSDPHQLSLDLDGPDALQQDDPGEEPIPGLRLRDGLFELARSAQPEARERFREWYRRRAADVLNARVAHFAPLVGVAPPPIAIKEMRSRWGSCSAKGRISLHWGLVLLPLELVDYVVVHELVHLRELHHQPAFWRGVEQVLSDYRERRRRLRGQDGRLVM